MNFYNSFSAGCVLASRAFYTPPSANAPTATCPGKYYSVDFAIGHHSPTPRSVRQWQCVLSECGTTNKLFANHCHKKSQIHSGASVRQSHHLYARILPIFFQEQMIKNCSLRESRLL